MELIKIELFLTNFIPIVLVWLGFHLLFSSDVEDILFKIKIKTKRFFRHLLNIKYKRPFIDFFLVKHHIRKEIESILLEFEQMSNKNNYSEIFDLLWKILALPKLKALEMLYFIEEANKILVKNNRVSKNFKDFLIKIETEKNSNEETIKDCFLYFIGTLESEEIEHYRSTSLAIILTKTRSKI